MSKNLSHLSGRKALSDNLFDRYGQLVATQESIEREDLAKLADEFLMGTSSIYGATTFYDFLKPENQGKKVYVCNGSACLCAGTQDNVSEKISARFDSSEIGTMCCLGRCHENSAFHYGGRNYSGADIDKLDNIIEEGAIDTDQYHIGTLGSSILTKPDEGIGHYKDLLRKIIDTPTHKILSDIKDSGLRGRGGAGFPMGLKLAFCEQAEGDTKFIICNADEGDPGAFSDRYLLEKAPMKVAMGMLIAGFVTGAEYGVFYIRGEYPESVRSVEKCLEDMRSHQMIGSKILNTQFQFHFKVIKAQGSYICGEETALINSIEGQRPEVRTRPPYPAQYGLFGKPTTVSNVETLAALPYIVNADNQAYQNFGTQKSAGTKLLSLDSAFARPGIYEVEMGTPLTEVIDAAGGFKTPVKALHIGGPLGGIVPSSKFSDLSIDFESFSDHGFLLGHASIVSIPTSFPMAKYLAHLFEFAAHESCGKCFPCRLGTKRAEELLKKSLTEEYQIDRSLFDDLLHTLEVGSLCAHGGGIPLPVRNAMQYFSEELDQHFSPLS